MTDTGISKCLSCGQEMHGTDYLDLLRRELAEAREHIKGYEAQAQSFHEEYRRKCDVEIKDLQERLTDTQHRNGANIVRLERAEDELAEARKDAERYHKLIGMLFEYSLHFRSAGPNMQLCNNSFVLGEGAGADAAIDAARKP